MLKSKVDDGGYTSSEVMIQKERVHEVEYWEARVEGF